MKGYAMNLVTVGDIARSLEVDRDAVAYAIRKARIEPAVRQLTCRKAFYLSRYSKGEDNHASF